MKYDISPAIVCSLESNIQPHTIDIEKTFTAIDEAFPIYRGIPATSKAAIREVELEIPAAPQ